MNAATFVGPGWRIDGNAAVRGRGFDQSGEPIDLLDVFSGTKSFDQVVDVARRLDGFYAAVVDGGDERYLVCDHARTVPLYFTTDVPARVADTTAVLPSEEPFDPVAASEFVLSRYVTRGETLFPSIASVRSGEVVRLPLDDPGSYERHRYARYRPTTRVEGEHELLERRMRTVLDDVFDRVVKVADGRPVAVPLSGGWDSRLVATLLVERGVEVVAFTFGVPGHADVEVSRDVADALDVRWEWVEYDTDRWHDWYHTDDRRAYHDYAFGHDALPFLAEWPAVRELLADGRLPTDALVCPGHTVATPSERVPPEWLDGTPDREDVIDHVLDEQYALWEWDDRDFRAAFADRIVSDASLGRVRSGPEAAAAYEQWEWTTRMATFTNGDARVYDWFDLEWWFPLWDAAYVSFWSSVPLAHRQGKSLQVEFAADRFADVAGIDAAVARRTDADWTPLDGIRRTFATDPAAVLGDSYDRWLGAGAVPPSAWEEWGNYPLGWYGAIPESAADRFAAARNFYALRTLEAVGGVSFDPPWIHDPPLDAEIDLPTSGPNSDAPGRNPDR